MEGGFEPSNTVDQERTQIYETWGPYFQSKSDKSEIKVIGVYIGGRGTISFKIPLAVVGTVDSVVLKEIALICPR